MSQATKSRPAPRLEVHAPPAAGFRVIDVTIETIQEPVANHRAPRKLTPKAIGELAAEIKSDGLQSPIRVWAPPGAGLEQVIEAGGPWHLVYGTRRMLAFVALGRARIPAIVSAAADPDPERNARELAKHKAIENLHHEGLDPLEEALACSSLVETAMQEMDGKHFGSAIEAVAEKTGKTRRWVRERCTLLRLCEPVRRLVHDGRLTLERAKIIATLVDPDDQVRLADTAALDPTGQREPPSLYTLRSRVRSMGLQLRGVPWQLHVAFDGKAACKACQHNSTNQHGLFDDGEHEDNLCLYRACYEHKLAVSQRAGEKAARKLAELPTLTRQTIDSPARTPEFLRVDPLLKRAREIQAGETKPPIRETKPPRGETKPAVRETPTALKSDYEAWVDEVRKEFRRWVALDPIRLCMVMAVGFHAESHSLTRHDPGRFAGELMELLRAIAEQDLQTFARGLRSSIEADGWNLGVWEQAPTETLYQAAVIMGVQLRPAPKKGGG